MKEKLLRLIRSSQGLLILLMLTNTLIGLLCVTDYGISIDEPEVYEAAFYRFNAYRTGSVPEDFYTLNKYSHGGGYYVIGRVITEVLERLIVNWSMFDEWHFTHFLFFQLGGVFIFILARRLVSDWASLGAAILFYYQPVLWGHAFINPKDTPFMTLMLGALVLGLNTGDQLPFWIPRSNQQPSTSDLQSCFKQVMETLISILKIKWFVPTVILLALCCSTRVHGLIIWLAIGFYWWLKAGHQAIVPWVSLIILSALLGLALWPDLWPAPIQNYFTFWSNVFSFGGWNEKILFAGEMYNKANYPRSFLPVLLSLKFTEPLMVLFVIGLVGCLIWTLQKKADWVLVSLLVIWFFGPVLLAVIMHPTIYNNIRHFLFILPPIFIFASVGLEILVKILKHSLLRWSFLALVALPGIVAIIQLHPMEYIYFNQIAKGVPGAFRDYELDYWLTSYRQAAEIINEKVPQRASVGVYLEYDLIKDFLREDISSIFIRGSGLRGSQYVVISTNLDYDLELEARFPDLQKFGQVERCGVPLTKIYKVPGDN